MTHQAPLLPPAIAQLEAALDTIRREELDRYRKKMAPEEATLLAFLTAGINGKIVDLLAARLEAALQRGEVDTRLQVLHTLFTLEATPVRSGAPR